MCVVCCRVVRLFKGKLGNLPSGGSKEEVSSFRRNLVSQQQHGDDDYSITGTKSNVLVESWGENCRMSLV